MSNIKHVAFSADRPIDILHNARPMAETSSQCLLLLVDENDVLQVWGTDLNAKELSRMAVKVYQLADNAVEGEG